MTSSPSNKGSHIKGASSRKHHGRHTHVVIENEGTDQERVYYKKKHKKHMSKGKKIAIVIVLILIAIAIGAVAAFNYVNTTTANAIHEANQNANVTAGDSKNADQTVQYQGHTYKLNEDIVSILIIGHDDESRTNSDHTTQADMVAVAAVNTKTGAINIINIPRDSMVTVDQYGLDADGNAAGYVGQKTEQLCLAYTYGKGVDAINNVKAAVQRVLYNTPIMYYFDLDESGIPEINDAVGGVTLTPIATIPGTGIVEGQTTTLFGENARSYVEYRDTSVDGSSLARQERQAQYLQAFVQTLFSDAGGNVNTIVNVFNTASKYVTTNLDTNAVIYLGTSCINNGVSVASTTTLPTTLDASGYYNVYYLDKDATMKTVIDTYYTLVS